MFFMFLISPAIVSGMVWIARLNSLSRMRAHVYSRRRRPSFFFLFILFLLLLFLSFSSSFSRFLGIDPLFDGLSESHVFNPHFYREEDGCGLFCRPPHF